MKEVSIDEYIAALRIVEQYHKQLKSSIFIVSSLSKHLIVDFIARCGKLTPSMEFGLLRQKKISSCNYIEDLNFDEMESYPGLGKVSVEKLKQYINQYLNEN